MPNADRRGIFLALEGVEGAGKSTQVKLLEAWLRERGLDPVVTREPGGTRVGEEARRILLHSEDLTSETELLLMLAARSALVAEVIRPALEAGRVVVTDRFALSTVACCWAGALTATSNMSRKRNLIGGFLGARRGRPSAAGGGRATRWPIPRG